MCSWTRCEECCWSGIREAGARWKSQGGELNSRSEEWEGVTETYNRKCCGGM